MEFTKTGLSKSDAFNLLPRLKIILGHSNTHVK